MSDCNFEYRTDVDPQVVADMWGRMERTDGSDYMLLMEPSEPFWLDIGGEPRNSGDGERHPTDIPVLDCQSDEYDLQPVYLGPGVLGVFYCLDRHPKTGRDIQSSLAQTVASIQPDLSQDGGTPRVVGDDGQVWSCMKRRCDDWLLMQGFCNLNIPDSVRVQTGAGCAYVDQPGSFRVPDADVIDALSCPELAEPVEFDEHEHVNIEEPRSDNPRSHLRPDVTVERRYTVPEDGVRPEVFPNEWTESVNVESRDGGRVTLLVEAGPESHKYWSGLSGVRQRQPPGKGQGGP